ncbi:MAG TPA: hypothetical protein VFN17_08085 [Nitrosarchaeum sp.]|nr:hypothetical protein [Nitrosarchaeum sp.]
MKANFVISSVLTVILFGSAFGLFVVDDVFAQNLYVSSDDSEAYKKQKELEAKKAERQAKSEEKQKELEAKKAELKIHRENLELKQLKKSQEYEEKLKEIKEKSQYSIAKNTSDDEDISQKSKNLEEKTIKKSDEIQKKLAAKSDKLDLRTKNILDKINDGQYMGEKITSSTNTDKYELSFDLVDTYLINDKSQTSSLTGKMSFSTYDKSKSDLKLELDYCEITVDEIVYNCGFGKARTVSSGQSSAKNSLVIVAFLEDNVLEEVHTTMKIFLNADIPINKIEESQVSILGPQSKISNLWFLNGTATLSKIVSTPEQTPTGTNSTITLDDGISTGDK